MGFRSWMRTAGVALAGAALIILAVLPVPGARTQVAGELVVADPTAGVALFGFDPVAYFLSGRAEAGSEDLELRFGSLVWRFRNEANRAAFRAQPDIYVPQFGGYDAVALARGVPVAGHPASFAVHGERIYLFQKPEHRAAFLAAPKLYVEAALANWPEVRRSLVH